MGMAGQLVICPHIGAHGALRDSCGNPDGACQLNNE